MPDFDPDFTKVVPAGDLTAPLLGFSDGAGTGVPLAAGRLAGRKSEFHFGADAPQACHADDRPSFRRDAAEDAWRRCLSWFQTHGVA